MKLYIDQKNNVVTMHEASGDMKCFEEFENSKPYTFDTVKEVKGLENPVHILLNTSMIDEMEMKILNSSILMLTGGAPDLMMKRIKDKKLKKIIKNYKGIMIGYSAGAMIQLDLYHISPDEDYPEFSYQNGLGCLSGFDIEPHFRRSKIQMESIEKVKEEKGISIYGIYEDGGMIIDKGITCFGKIDLF